jgi:hypothetical protein
MAQERLTLRKIQEILRLKEEAGLSTRAIGRVCKISHSTPGEEPNQIVISSEAYYLQFHLPLYIFSLQLC